MSEGFLLSELDFRYNDQNHKYEDVEHIYWKRTHTKVTKNFTSAGSYDDAVLGITLYGDSKILEEKAGAILFATFRNTKLMCDELNEKYNMFREKTFENRLKNVFDFIMQNGYFMYSGYKIMRNGDILLDNGKNIHNLYDDILSSTIDPFMLTIKKKTTSKLGDLKASLTGHIILLTTDIDLFFPILSTVYKIEFGKTTQNEKKPLIDFDNSKYKKCPFCAEKILSEAIKCKHCGSMLKNDF